VYQLSSASIAATRSRRRHWWFHGRHTRYHGAMPRFVLLRHECPPGSEKPSHWDLMLERGEVLRTLNLFDLPPGWKDPSLAHSTLGCETAALDDVDHRLEYLDYEGPISGNRGAVTRLDRGEYLEPVADPDIYQVELKGSRIRGLIKCEHMFGILSFCSITLPPIE
jgi:hypothetical protein